MKDFTDKVAIVTGAGSGIGRALGEALLRSGAVVVLADINTGRIKDIIASSVLQDRLTACVLDVADFDQVKKVVNETIARHGRLDYIFNNAGIVVGAEARDCSIDDWRDVVSVNLMGVINGVAAAYPVMVAQGFGHIVNTASIEGLVPFPGTCSYVASKFGVVGLSGALRIEGRDMGVKVTAVCPGHIDTRIFHDSKMIKFDREKIIERLPKSLSMTPEQCAAEILKGVMKNKRLIVVTAAAKWLWWMQRFFPGVVQWMMQKNLAKSRIDMRLEEG